MAKKNPMEKILARLKGGKSDFQMLQADGMTVQVLVKNGKVDLDSEVRVNNLSIPVRQLLHAAEIVKLAGSTGGMCVLHGAFDGVSMGCGPCRDELHGVVSEEISAGRTVHEGNAETA